jgi:fumarate hydratase class II
MTRVENDSMGEMEVAAEALHGASTQRAVLNFPISGRRFPRSFLKALGLIKWAAATTNGEIGLLPAEKADLIAKIAEEVIRGDLDGHFPVDIFQTGSGTSTNTNANEVIANRASLLTGKSLGSHDPLHPNDDVNLGQSSNDVIPTAMHISVAMEIEGSLIPALSMLQTDLLEKAADFDWVIKIGRTHLMDATPVRVGQVFGGYARQAEKSVDRAKSAIAALLELPLGGTAVGTGINTHRTFAGKAIARIVERTSLPFREAADHFEAQSAKDGIVEAAGCMKTIAISLTKIANDIRWLGSGPRCGIGEIRLPAIQPGSSIMPGKVNPVMSEALMQVCAEVVGMEATIAWSAGQGNFELNVMMPVMADRLLESIRILSNAVALFSEKCIKGLTVDEERCHHLVEQSFALVTALVPVIGYDRAAELAKLSVETGQPIRKICEDQAILGKEALINALDAWRMTLPTDTI